MPCLEMESGLSLVVFRAEPSAVLCELASSKAMARYSVSCMVNSRLTTRSSGRPNSNAMIRVIVPPLSASVRHLSEMQRYSRQPRNRLLVLLWLLFLLAAAGVLFAPQWVHLPTEYQAILALGSIWASTFCGYLADRAAASAGGRLRLYLALLLGVAGLSLSRLRPLQPGESFWQVVLFGGLLASLIGFALGYALESLLLSRKREKGV